MNLLKALFVLFEMDSLELDQHANFITTNDN